MALSEWLVRIPQWLSALLVFGFFVSFGVGAILIVRRFVHHSVLKPYNDISGFIYANIGVIYAVVFGLVIFNVGAEYNGAKQLVEHESAEAYQLYRDLNLYPNRVEADKVLVTLRNFTLSVVHDEFPAIKALKWDSKYQPSLATHKASSDLWVAIAQIVPRNLHEQSLYNEILKDVNSLSQYRVKRRVMARDDLPGVLWAVVVFGGLITITFSALFGHENVRVHILITAILALMVSSGVFVIVTLNFPFSGNLSVSPDGYEYLIDLAKW